MADEQRNGGAGREPSDGTNAAEGTGESGGGARPGQRAGGDGGEDAGFTGHGGQSDIGYHGPGQLGGKVVGDGPNENAGTEEG